MPADFTPHGSWDCFQEALKAVLAATWGLILSNTAGINSHASARRHVNIAAAERASEKAEVVSATVMETTPRRKPRLAEVLFSIEDAERAFRAAELVGA